MSLKQNSNRPLKKMPNSGGMTACRECGKPLTTPVTAKRGMCRSCWRVHKVMTADATT